VGSHEREPAAFARREVGEPAVGAAYVGCEYFGHTKRDDYDGISAYLPLLPNNYISMVCFGNKKL
jgi:hypothetical protein